MSFGEKLKEVREAKGYSLDYIEEETKIRKLYINALEQETFEVLPPRVYATGFVRRYSKFLGLNADEMVVEFQSRAYYNESIHEEVAQIGQKEVDIGFPVLYRNILAGIVFFIIALWAGKLVLGYITGRMDIPDQQATVPPKVEEPVKHPSPPVPEVKRALVLIEARQDCWLNVVVDGETVFTKIIKAGDKQEFKGKESVVTLSFNGTAIYL